MDFIIIGKRIKELRKSKNLTQEQLSEKIKKSEKYISNIETGSDSCSLSLLIDIANELGASVDYLLSDNLIYNSINCMNDEYFDDLLHEISLLDTKDKQYILKMIRLLKDYKSDI